MAQGKHSRVDGRKSSSYFSTISVVVFVAFSLVGIWMFMSSIIPVENSNLSNRETVNEVKQIVTENGSGLFLDSTDDISKELTKWDIDTSESQSGGHFEIQNNPNTSGGESNNTAQEDRVEKGDEGFDKMDDSDKNSTSQVEKNQKEMYVEMSVEENSESKEGSNSQHGDSSLAQETGKVTGQANEGKETESEGSLEESRSKLDMHGKKSDAEDNTIENKHQEETSSGVEEETIVKDQEKYTDQSSGENNIENPEKNEASDEVSPTASQSEVLNEATTQRGAWSTQALESQNEMESQLSSNSQNVPNWKLCNVTAGADYIPCLDNWQAIRKLPSRMHYEHRERHCPDVAPTCLVPLPEGYRIPIKWPQSREKIWYYNVPHTKLAEVKGHQNWVKVDGEYLTFPGGGTQFIHGALHYIEYIQKSLPSIAWGKKSRVILDVGCGVASFGGYLFEKDVLAMSFAPKDEHEAQVQFALERGIPAILGVMGTKRLPFPGSVFDLVHCARCRVPWHIEGGKLLLELNRVLRPGGYFVWSATPVYRKGPEDVGIWKAMSQLTKSMCWDLLVVRKDNMNGVAAAIFKKPTSNECYKRRPQNEPPLCNESDDPNAAWNVPLQACMHKVPLGASERGSRWPMQWPMRLEKPPDWLKLQDGVYGKAAPADFNADYEHWKYVFSHLYQNQMGINWSSLRNIMDMRAVYGGFAASLKNLNMWVMNVMPVDSPDTLPLIYERGLFGVYHDWCESFNTYPRSYDLLHSDNLFSSLKRRCNMVGVIAEIDRILRPEGILIVRDNVETVGQIQNLVKSLQWNTLYISSNDNEGLLCVQKTLWRPKIAETIMSAIV